MSDKTIADFEWASISRYVAHVEQVAGLQQISLDKIHSFRIGLAGAKSLLRVKCRTKEAIRENNRLLCLYVANRVETLKQPEKDVLRGMYTSNRDALETLEKHIELLENIPQSQYPLLIPDDDDLPF